MVDELIGLNEIQEKNESRRGATEDEQKAKAQA